MGYIAWRYRQFHISYALGFCAVGLLAGIALAQVWAVHVTITAIISIVASIFLACYSRRWYALVVIVLSSTLLGATHGTAVLNELKGYEQFIGHKVELHGRVDDDPKLTKYHTQAFTVSDVTISGQAYRGTVYVASVSQEPIGRGDAVVIRGSLAEGFGQYPVAFRKSEIVSRQKRDDPLLAVRDHFANTVRKYVAEPAASLGLGFVVGQRSNLPDDLDDQLRIVGLTHIVVASGYNLTILVRLSRRLFEKVSRYSALVTSLSLMSLFIAVSGASPSMVRAGAVTGLSLLAWYYGRTFHPLLLILYVAAATAWINPVYEWYDIGWYLSFLAFAGVLLIAPLITKMVFRNNEAPTFLQVVIETVAAQLMTLPLILMIFGNLPVLSVLSNMLVAPVIPLAMMLTAVVGLVGLAVPLLATFIGVMTTIIIDYVLAVVTVLSKPEWSQLQVGISPFMMAFSFLVIGVATVLVYRRLRFNYRQSSIVD